MEKFMVPAIVYPVQTGGKLHNIIFKSESSVNDFFVDFFGHFVHNYLHWITFRSDHLSLFGQEKQSQPPRGIDIYILQVMIVLGKN